MSVGHDVLRPGQPEVLPGARQMDIARGDHAMLTRIAAVAIREDRRAQPDVADDKARQRRRGGVGDDLDPTAARALASDLDRDHERLAVDELAAAAEPELLAADERLVDLDCACQRLPVRKLPSHARIPPDG